MPRRTGPLLAAAALAFGASLAFARPRAAAPPPPPAAADLPERIIEKTDGDYVLRLTLRPGNLKVNRVATASVEIFKNLDIPDPVTGSTAPMTDSHPIATVTTPEDAPSHGRNAEEPTSTRYLLWAKNEEPGTFAFHFTPEQDGVYQVSITGTDANPGGTDNEARSFTATYRIGAGTAAAQTERTQSVTASRHATRRPVGGDDSDDPHQQLVKVMNEIGYRYLDLQSLLEGAPSHGADAAAEAQAIAALFSKAKRLTPEGAGGDYATLAEGAGSRFTTLAEAAQGRDRKAAHKAFDSIESVGCDECHAKYRFNVTDDVSIWPQFSQKAVEQ